jgi:hypothetical protein
MTKPKLLWSGDLAAMTGFGRVGGALLPRLRDHYEIVVLANNWHGDCCPEQEMFKMYPASNRFQQNNVSSFFHPLQNVDATKI